MEKTAVIKALKPYILVPVLLLAAEVRAELASSTVELEAIRHVYLLGRHDLVITQGEREYITVTADERYLGELEARIKGNVLALGQESESFWNWGRSSREATATFEVQLRDLRSINSRGSGTVEIGSVSIGDGFLISNQGSGTISAQSIIADQLDLRGDGSGKTRIQSARADDLSIRIHGSGSASIGTVSVESAKIQINGAGKVDLDTGQATDLEIAVNGAGDLDSAGVESARVKVGINGAGDVAVFASELLDVRINGSGDVRYAGRPEKVERSVRGAGRIEPLN